jgi:hypothetical protein
MDGAHSMHRRNAKKFGKKISDKFFFKVDESGKIVLGLTLKDRAWV